MERVGRSLAAPVITLSVLLRSLELEEVSQAIPAALLASLDAMVAVKVVWRNNGELYLTFRLGQEGEAQGFNRSILAR